MELTHHTRTTEHHPHNGTNTSHTNYWTPPTQWTHHTRTTEHHPHNGTAGIPEPPTVSCQNCTRTRDGAKGEGEEADEDWTTSVRSYRWMFPSSSPTLSTPATNMIKATELIHLVYNLTAPYNTVLSVLAVVFSEHSEHTHQCHKHSTNSNSLSLLTTVFSQHTCHQHTVQTIELCPSQL